MYHPFMGWVRMHMGAGKAAQSSRPAVEGETGRLVEAAQSMSAAKDQLIRRASRPA